MLPTTSQRLTALLASMIVLASIGAVAGRDAGPPAVRSRVVAVPSAVPTPTSTPRLEATPEMTAVPTAVPTTRPRPVATKRPAPATVEPTTAVGTGDVLTVSEPGIWVLDVNAKVLRRVSDPAVFDVSDDRLITTSGRAVLSQPIGGGPGQVLYELPSLLGRWFPNADLSGERVSEIDMGPDGTAFVSNVAAFGNGGAGVSSLVGPDGAVLAVDIRRGDTEWSDDGQMLAVAYGSTLHGYRRDGSHAWAHEVPEILTGLRWTPDGGTVVGKTDASRLRRVEVPGGGTSLIEPLRQHIDFAPDGRALGQRQPPGGWSGRTHPGIALWDPKTGTVDTWASSGTEANWSHDGSKVWLFDTPLTGAADGDRFSLRVRTAGGEPVLTVHPTEPNLRIVRAGAEPSFGLSWPEPLWAGDRIAFLVYALP